MTSLAASGWVFRRWFQISGFTRQRGTDAFWCRVAKRLDAAACWPWTGGRSGSGYGNLWWRGSKTYAHRVAWELANGRPIPAGMLVRHHCDNPLCCRPSHLALGKHRDNMADMAERGRSRRGLLSPALAVLIRASERPSTHLAAELGVSPTAIQMVRRQEVYRNVEA
jgi:hypothetical protein